MSLFLLILFLAALYLRPADLAPGLAPYRIPLVAGLAALVAALVRCAATRSSAVLRMQHPYFFGGFVTVAVLSPALTRGWFGGVPIAIEDLLPGMLAAVLIVMTVDSLQRLRILGAAICVLSLYLVAQSVLAYHFGVWEDVLVLTEHRETIEEPDAPPLLRVRALGHMNDPNDLAQGLITAMPLLWVAWRRRRPLRNAVLAGLTFALAYGVYLTRSRGAVVSLIAVAFLLVRALSRRSGWMMPAAATVLVGVILWSAGFAGGREFSAGEISASSRIDAWGAGIQMLRQHPLFGVGYRAFEENFERTAHNSFVHCFAELGMTGYFFWVGLLVATAFGLNAVRKTGSEGDLADDLRRWALMLQLSFYGFLVGAFFLSRVYVPTLYIVIAMAVALMRIADDSGVSLVPARPAVMLARTGVLMAASVVLVYVVILGSRFAAA